MMLANMETLLGVAAGIGLSAACGFRVFLPLLALNLASLSGHLHLSSEFAWLGSYHATVALGAATILEVLGYYVPWIDHILDLIATPAAVVAGALATASVVTNISPFLKWMLALIAGGGVAGLMQGATVALRAGSTGATAGLGNPLVATMELAGSIVTVLLALFVPVLCVALVVFLCIVVARKMGRLVFGRQSIRYHASRREP